MHKRNVLRARNTGIPALLAAAMLAGCGGGTPTPASNVVEPTSDTGPPTAVVQAQNNHTAVDPAIVAADNSFGLALLNQLSPGTSGNVAISPLSVAMALQIVYNGAAGTTQTAMADTLALGGLSTASVNGDNAALQASLLNPDPAVQVTIANSLWMHLASNPVLPSFTATDQTYYGATLGDLAGAPDNVNAWVATETNGLIAQILPAEPPGYYQSVLAIIANAIYFKGQWTTPFDPNRTAAGPFTLSDGTQVTAQMMQQVGSYQYLQGTLQGAAFQAVRVPYGAGRLNMLIVLPAPGTALTGFVAGMTAAQLNAWNAQFQSAFGSIALPRFAATYSSSLPAALSALGMGVAFCTSGQADFSGIATNPPPCISDVEHKTVVEVDESGTVAAGATTVTVTTTAVPATSFSMTMNRPFFYAIEDDATGELLFVGLLMNPVE
jgi:serine protease inhibitor